MAEPQRSGAVNNSPARREKSLVSLGEMTCSQAVHSADLVNKLCVRIRCQACENLISCSQFIERTEMGGSSQQIEAERLKDNPR